MWDPFLLALACRKQKDHRGDETFSLFQCGDTAYERFSHFFLKMDLSVENDWSHWTYGQLEQEKLNVTKG